LSGKEKEMAAKIAPSGMRWGKVADNFNGNT